MVSSFLLLVERLNYCPRCGASLTGTTRPGYKVLLRRALPWATGAILFLFGALLLFAILIGSLGHTWEELQHGNDVTFHNTTNTTLYLGPPSQPLAVIGPRGKSYWGFYPGDSGPLLVEVALFTPEGEQIYKGVADGKKWEGAFIVINQQRNGEFNVVDSINAPPN
jgi:hypothetical protein